MKNPVLTPQAAEVLTGMMRAGLLAPSCDHETQKSQSLVPVAEVVPPPPDRRGQPRHAESADLRLFQPDDQCRRASATQADADEEKLATPMTPTATTRSASKLFRREARQNQPRGTCTPV